MIGEVGSGCLGGHLLARLRGLEEPPRAAEPSDLAAGSLALNLGQVKLVAQGAMALGRLDREDTEELDHEDISRTRSLFQPQPSSLIFIPAFLALGRTILVRG